MKAMGGYDGTLQMFIEEGQELDMQRLRFLRWLGERGKLEHPIAGPPAGPLIVAGFPADGEACGQDADPLAA